MKVRKRHRDIVSIFAMEHGRRDNSRRKETRQFPKRKHAKSILALSFCYLGKVTGSREKPFGDLFLFYDRGKEEGRSGNCTEGNWLLFIEIIPEISYSLPSSFHSTVMAVKRISIATIETNRQLDLIILFLDIRIFSSRVKDVRAGCLSIRRIVVEDKKARRREG